MLEGFFFEPFLNMISFLLSSVFIALCAAKIDTVPTGGKVITVKPDQAQELWKMFKKQNPASTLNNGQVAQPGDELHLETGTYTLTSLLQMTLSGEPGKYIVIRSKPGHKARIDRPQQNQNIIDMTISYIYWYDLEITGGSAGFRLMGNTHHNTFDKLNMHSIQHVSFRANDGGSDVHDNLIQHCEIHHPSGPSSTGEGMYLGCNNNACAFHDNIVRANHIHHILGVGQGDGIEVKRGSYGNLIIDNVVHDTNYPGIFVYGQPDKPRNRVINNYVFSANDNCIQVTSHADVIGNVIANCGNNGIEVKNNQGDPEEVLIAQNTIYARIPLRFSSTTNIANAKFEVERNVLFGSEIKGGGSEIKYADNVWIGGSKPAQIAKSVSKTDAFQVPPPDVPNYSLTVDWKALNFHPKDALKMASAGMVANDLECTTGHRSNGYVGAFQGTTVVWPIAEDFKPCCSCMGTTAPTMMLTMAPTPMPKAAPVATVAPTPMPKAAPVLTVAPTPMPKAATVPTNQQPTTAPPATTVILGSTTPGTTRATSQVGQTTVDIVNEQCQPVNNVVALGCKCDPGSNMCPPQAMCVQSTTANYLKYNCLPFYATVVGGTSPPTQAPSTQCLEMPGSLGCACSNGGLCVSQSLRCAEFAGVGSVCVEAPAPTAESPVISASSMTIAFATIMVAFAAMN